MSYMFASDESSIAAEWEKYKGYTVRPLPSTVSYYESVIAHHADRGRCMMYGGTPEIRSIFQKNEITVDMRDRSALIVRAMGHLTTAKQSIANNETFIQGDWIDDVEENNKYDFLIGDDAINMVRWADFNRFLKNAHRLLNIDGVFVCHLLVKPDEELIDKELSELVNEYETGIIKSRFDLASRLNFMAYDRETFAMGWQQTIHQLGAEQLTAFKPEFDFIETFGMCNSHFYCPPQLAFETIAKKYFTIREIFYPHEHDYCMFEPVYILQKIAGDCV